jgi:NTP pyrophosphatase (non-canonical NTP hydrolase)
MENVIYERALNEAITLYGEPSQTINAIEEMAELTKELCKLHFKNGNGDHIREEIADVEIMLSQLRIMFDVKHGEGSIDDIKGEKIARLEKRISEEVARRSIGTDDRDD